MLDQFRQEKCRQSTISRKPASGSQLQSSLVAELKKTPARMLEYRSHFRSCGHWFYNLSVETNISLLGPVLSCRLSELKKTFAPKLEARTDFWCCAPSSCNLPIETRDCSWCCSFISFSFHATESICFGARNENGFSECGLCSCNVLAEEEHLWSRSHLSTVLSFWATQTFTGTRTGQILSEQ